RSTLEQACIVCLCAGFWTPATTRRSARSNGPASKKRQGTKSREGRRRLVRWPISELATCLIEDRAGRHSGTDLLTLSSSHFGRRTVIRHTAHSIASVGAGERQAGTESRILSWNLAAGSAFLSTILPRSSKPMGESVGLSWQQGPLSTGAIGRFLVPEPLPKRLL